MLTIAICDDDQTDIHTLKDMVIRFFTCHHARNYEIQVFRNGKSLLESNTCYDIVFLDIEMDELNGIEVGQTLRKNFLQTRIIYVTSHNSYHMDAFSVHAFQYLLKPISYKNIETVLLELIRYMNHIAAKDIISFNVDGEIIKLKLQDIQYLEFTDRKIRVVLKQRSYYLRGSLKTLYEKLKESHFDMPHKAFIVNYLHIKKIAGSELILKDDTVIPLSQKKAAAFREKYFDYLHNIYNIL